MTSETIGIAGVLVVTLVMGLAHRGASRDPYQNFVTHLVYTWYDAHSPYEGDALLGLLRVCSWVHFVVCGGCVAVLIVRFVNAFELR
jgi:hypothetical protein